MLRLKVCARDVALALAGPGSTRELLDARAASAVQPKESAMDAESLNAGASPPQRGAFNASSAPATTSERIAALCPTSSWQLPSRRAPLLLLPYLWRKGSIAPAIACVRRARRAALQRYRISTCGLQALLSLSADGSGRLITVWSGLAASSMAGLADVGVNRLGKAALLLNKAVDSL